MFTDMHRSGSLLVFRLFQHRKLCLAVALVMLFAPGCIKHQGPDRYDLSGSITFNGKPVSVGSIVFVPDVSKGNDGPGSTAEIKDGAYRTLARRGTIGGPHVAIISGFNGIAYRKGGELCSSGKSLFPIMHISIDLPKESAKYDFILPLKNK
jgi:hypothetical protein